MERRPLYQHRATALPAVSIATAYHGSHFQQWRREQDAVFDLPIVFDAIPVDYRIAGQ